MKRDQRAERRVGDHAREVGCDGIHWYLDTWAEGIEVIVKLYVRMYVYVCGM